MIPENDNLGKIILFVEKNEFPDFIYPTKEAMRLVLDYKLPVMIYFNDIKDDHMVDIVKMVAKPYKEYFLLLIVNLHDLDKNPNKVRIEFFKNFMNVKSAPYLCILNLRKSLRRYKFIGNLEANMIDYFIQNYLFENLK